MYKLQLSMEDEVRNTYVHMYMRNIRMYVHMYVYAMRIKCPIVKILHTYVYFVVCVHFICIHTYVITVCVCVCACVRVCVCVCVCTMDGYFGRLW